MQTALLYDPIKLFFNIQRFYASTSCSMLLANSDSLSAEGNVCIYYLINSK